MRISLARPGVLEPKSLAVLQYALRLADRTDVQTDDGDVELWEALSGFRRWLLESLQPPMKAKGGPDLSRIQELLPAIYDHCAGTQRFVLGKFSDRLAPNRLEQELRTKELVLVLGGGGGACFSHLGALTLLKEISWVPKLIVGTSMGSLIGLLRSLNREWDPVETLMSLPRPFDLERVLSTARNRNKYGFPGAFALKLREIAQVTFDLLGRQNSPTFDDLPIRLEVVVAGVRRGIRAAVDRLGLAARDVAAFGGIRLKRRLGGLAELGRTLTSNPRFLAELVFGRDELTRNSRAIDAVGFSCAIPGLFSYGLSEDSDPSTIDVVKRLFDEHQLWSLADGGIVNNVPSRVAWESVQAGTIGSRNAFIYALDAFAPHVNTNLMFMPMQQWANRTVVSNQIYADLHKSYASPPSPVRLAMRRSRLKNVVLQTKNELEVDRGFLEHMKRPLPRFDDLDTRPYR